MKRETRLLMMILVLFAMVLGMYQCARMSVRSQERRNQTGWVEQGRHSTCLHHERV